jgi:hypothetical protein
MPSSFRKPLTSKDLNLSSEVHKLEKNRYSSVTTRWERSHKRWLWKEAPPAVPAWFGSRAQPHRSSHMLPAGTSTSSSPSVNPRYGVRSLELVPNRQAAATISIGCEYPRYGLGGIDE